jgi:hypothetical protein
VNAWFTFGACLTAFGLLLRGNAVLICWLEYSEEISDFGLVTINSDGSAQLLPDYNTLQNQFNTLNVTALQDQKAQNTSITPPTCSPSLILSSTFNSNFTIPAVPPGAQDLIDNGIQNAPVGKLVSIPSTKVTQKVEQVNGDVITGLAITILANDQSNNPSGASATTSSAPAATTTKKSNARGLRASLSVLLGAALLVVGSGSLL